MRSQLDRFWNSHTAQPELFLALNSRAKVSIIAHLTGPKRWLLSSRLLLGKVKWELSWEFQSILLRSSFNFFFSLQQTFSGWALSWTPPEMGEKRNIKKNMNWKIQFISSNWKRKSRRTWLDHSHVVLGSFSLFTFWFELQSTRWIQDEFILCSNQLSRSREKKVVDR